MLRAQIDFSRKIREWDGFGFNYVETAQTLDYDSNPQDYGGFSLLKEPDRQQIIDLVFGNDGLRPGIVKMFLDPFHQPVAPSLRPAEDTLFEHSEFNHEKTTAWMRYMAREGLKKTRSWGGNLAFMTALYGPPAWMTKQQVVRGRDLDPSMRLDCARYMIAWARYLRETEMLPVRYISLHNEGESWRRWNKEGFTPSNEGGHDYNLFWTPEMVLDFLKLTRKLLDKNGMADVGVTPGETSNWYRFYEWGYADAIASDPQALESMALITSHGFYGSNPGRWYGDWRSAGIDAVRAKNPDLHAWVTSTSWSAMDAKFAWEMHNSIYSAKVNAVIPWAGIQRSSLWTGGDPNPGTAIRIQDDGSWAIEPGYYFYKPLCRAGQPGTAVCATVCNESEIALIGFSSNGTRNTDSFVIINIGAGDWDIPIEIRGSTNKAFSAFRTSGSEKYVDLGEIPIREGKLGYCAPGGSVTAFFGAR